MRCNLFASIARGLADADAGRTKPAREVFDRLSAKYQAMADKSDGAVRRRCLRGKAAPPAQTVTFLTGWVLLDYGMPTVLRFDGLRVVIYPNDHRPAHVHVSGADGEAVFILHCPSGPPELRESYGFSRQAVGRILVGLAAHLTALCTHWSDIHGHY